MISSVFQGFKKCVFGCIEVRAKTRKAGSIWSAIEKIDFVCDYMGD